MAEYYKKMRTSKKYSKSSAAGWRSVTFSRSALIDNSSFCGTRPKPPSWGSSQGHGTHDHGYIEVRFNTERWRFGASDGDR